MLQYVGLNNDPINGFIVDASDRFDDDNVAGLCLFEETGEKTVIDTFPLSRRATGRGSKNAIFSGVDSLAKDRICADVFTEFQKLDKHQPTLDFLTRFDLADRLDLLDFTTQQVSELSYQPHSRLLLSTPDKKPKAEGHNEQVPPVDYQNISLNQIQVNDLVREASMNIPRKNDDFFEVVGTSLQAPIVMAEKNKYTNRIKKDCFA